MVGLHEKGMKVIIWVKNGDFAPKMGLPRTPIKGNSKKGIWRTIGAFLTNSIDMDFYKY